MEPLQKELHEAIDDLNNTREKARLASSEENRALNRVNKAQKAIEDWLAAQKKNAPFGTNWTTRNLSEAPSRDP